MVSIYKCLLSVHCGFTVARIMYDRAVYSIFCLSSFSLCKEIFGVDGAGIFSSNVHGRYTFALILKASFIA